MSDKSVASQDRESGINAGCRKPSSTATMQKKKMNHILLQFADCRDEYKEKRYNEASGGLSS